MSTTISASASTSARPIEPTCESEESLNTLRELLEEAGTREPTPLELQLLYHITVPTGNVRAEGFLTTALEIAVKWKQARLWNQVAQQLQKLGTWTLEPKAVFETLSCFDFEVVKPCLDDLTKHTTPDETRRALRVLESLELIAAEESITASSVPRMDRFRKWAADRRRVLCQSLPAPTDQFDGIIQHCLRQGGLAYIHKHLLPLYTIPTTDMSTFLCGLAQSINSDDALPDNPSKEKAVLELMRASVKNLDFSSVRGCDQRVKRARDLISACPDCKVPSLLDMLFEAMIESLSGLQSKDSFLTVTTATIYPLLARLKGRADPIRLESDYSDTDSEATVEMKTHINSVVISISDVIVRHLCNPQNWPATDSERHVSFSRRTTPSEWLRPLLEHREVFSSFLKRVTQPHCVEQLAVNVVYDLVKLLLDDAYHTPRSELTILAKQYATHLDIRHALKALVDLEFLTEDRFDRSAFNALVDRLMSPESLRHSGRCAEVAFGLGLRAPQSDACSCSGVADIRAILRQSSACSVSDEIRQALPKIVQAWFASNLLVSPPDDMTPILHRRLNELRQRWQCSEPSGHRECALLADFICGTVYQGTSCIHLKVLNRPRIREHLLRHLDQYVPKDILTWGKSGRGVIWIRKKLPEMWEPTNWPKLQAYGQELLKYLTKDNKTAQEALRRDHPELYDACEKQRVGRSDGPQPEGNLDAVHKDDRGGSEGDESDDDIEVGSEKEEEPEEEEDGEDTNDDDDEAGDEDEEDEEDEDISNGVGGRNAEDGDSRDKSTISADTDGQTTDSEKDAVGRGAASASVVVSPRVEAPGAKAVKRTVGGFPVGPPSKKQKTV